MYEKIVELCNKNNISINELEKKLNFGNCTIRKWKNTQPAFNKVVTIANYFKVPITYFVDEEKEEKKGA